jgi:hypothetical protein
VFQTKIFSLVIYPLVKWSSKFGILNACLSHPTCPIWIEFQVSFIGFSKEMLALSEEIDIELSIGHLWLFECPNLQ